MRCSLLFVSSFLLAAGSLFAQSQNTQAKDPLANLTKGMPPRATPGDYASHAQAGNVTIAAEFAGHSVPRPEGPLTTEDYVVVEAALFGPPGTPITLSINDFTLRINGKKKPLPSEPFGLVTRSLKDPSWVSPDEAENKKSKSGLSTGGGQTDTTPRPVHIPIEMQRSMAQYVQKSSFPEGERPLPQAGLLFFEYRGKTQGIHSLELDYAGPAGKATLELQP